MTINQGKFFEDLRFERFEMKYASFGKYVCYKGHDGFFYRIGHFGKSYVVECAESEEEAKLHRFEDADLYDDSTPEKQLIAQIQMDLKKYVA